MASSGNSENGEVGMQIAPLLDVLFVLLLFFMVNAGLQTKEAELNAKLPGPTGKHMELKTPIRLAVLADGQILWEDAVIGAPEDKKLGALVAELTDTMQAQGDQPVIIAPEAEARHQRVIDVLSAADQANVKNLAFGTYRR